MVALGLRGPTSQAPATMVSGGPFRLLVRLFLRRFLENDLLSADGDTRVNLGFIVALLAAPGVFSLAWLMLPYSGPFITPSERLLMALDHKYQYIALSMILAALAAALEWDAMSIDDRDLAILGPLPIPPRRLLGAKIAALALFLLTLSAAVNVVPTLGFPAVWLSLVPIGPVQAARLTLVHGFVSLAAAATGFLAVIAVRSLVVLVCGPRAIRLASTITQFSLVLCLATLVLLSPMLPADVPAEIERPTHATFSNPAMWLLGGYERLTARGLHANPQFTAQATWTFWERQQLRRRQNLNKEVWAHPLPMFRTEVKARRRYQAMMPTLDRLAGRAGLLLPLGALASGGLYLLAYLWRGRGQREASAFASSARMRAARPLRWWAGAVATRHPLAQATFAFTLQALFRSGPQRLHLAGALALGCAVAFFLLFGQVDGPGVFPSTPTSSFLALQYVVVFFLLAGLRRAFAIPAALPANWVFRFTLDRGDARPALAGVRRAVIVAGVLPLFSVLALAHAIAWGPLAALAHFATGVLISLVLVEVLLAGFNKVPFTCPYVTGDARIWWPYQLGGLVAFAYGSGAIESVALSGPRAFTAVTAVVLVAVATIRLSATRRLFAARELTFEQQPDQAVQTLDI